MKAAWAMPRALGVATTAKWDQTVNTSQEKSDTYIKAKGGALNK